ncbi:hypothetical protein Fmac_010657 [Flemingia macrophylla]|uniref:Embryo defective 1703 n=1 Tax=Flemingia macrophylla TaxID=520843 RepID=A0ABD1MKH3_9FABA
MDVLNISSPTTFTIPTFCYPKTLTSKSPPNHKKPTSPFHRAPFPLHLSRSNAMKFQTLAHSGRPTNRRNSLRKKLLRDHKVRPNQNPNDPFSVSGNSVEESDAGVQGVSVVHNVVEIEKPKSKLLSESVLWNKLENWVDQYKKDIEYWGVGSGPVFTVFQDSCGGVKRVFVDEEEILKRSRVRKDVIGDFPEVRNKIQRAKDMAREMESGNNVIARNSSVAKFVGEGVKEGGFVKAVRGFVAEPRLLPRLSGIGRKVLYVLVVVWAVKKLFAFGEGDKEVEYTETEKEMMRRKMKARKEKEKLVKGAVEVFPNPSETPVVDIKKPNIDKEQLRDSILKAKASVDKLVVHDSSDKVKTRSTEMDYKVLEIREMARKARKIEGRDHFLANKEKIEGGDLVLANKDMKMDDPVVEKQFDDNKVTKTNSERDDSLSNHQKEVAMETTNSKAIIQLTSVDVPENIDNSVPHEVVPANKDNVYASDAVVPAADREIKKREIEFVENDAHQKGRENDKLSDSSIYSSSVPNESSVKKKPRIIRSVKDARNYLSKKHDKQYPGSGTEYRSELSKDKISDLKSSSAIDFNDQKCQNLEKNTTVSKSGTLNGMLDSKPLINDSEDSNQKDKELSPINNDHIKDSVIEPKLEDLQKYETTLDHEVSGDGPETRLSVRPEIWPEKNLDKVEPMIEQIRSDALDGLSDSKPATNPTEDSNQKDMEPSPTKDDYFKDSGAEPGIGKLSKSEPNLDLEVNGIGTERRLPDNFPDKNLLENSDEKNKEFGSTKHDYLKNTGAEPGIRNHQKSGATSDGEVNGINTGTTVSGKTENWLEKNFHEVEPIVNRIGEGFRHNYMAAKERVNQPLDIPSEMESLGVVEDGGEFDWMQDDHLRDIVFRVRDNELSGRDPFYLMNDEDKEAFFRGLEKKVEKENKNLSFVHEWLHSNIENLDYGEDGISIYDPPEKIVPRWKGPPVEKVPKFLNEFLDKRRTGSARNINSVKNDESALAKQSVDSSSLQKKVGGSTAPIKKMKIPKTIIEGSDGSVKVGKKSGKEYWQHTKKWSQGFLDSYNAETDPEIKSIMKDMGKDLDRWITEKEIEEAADLMDKLPTKNKSFMEKKLNKIKREMELFGPQAVVSKYREYADNEEEDYLWWLDLSHVLCIEMYTVEDGEQRVGLYSLEMATDLELEPKPYHVIAFQDPGDCKNLCYIIQAHLEMLGNGHAFVVARPPKDAFREAKANGIGVTVIKKGELQLNIDQPLEEVEEQITEIGSKMYHDMMMKERSVDINSLMKGVFGFSDRSIKRLKRKLKKPKKG